MSDDEWVSAPEAQAYVNRTDRQMRRYAQQGRVRTRKRGGRVEYARADLENIRDAMGDDTAPRGNQQIVPAGELMGYVRELQEQLQQSAAREGYLRAQLEQRLALPDERLLRDELATEREHRKTLEAELRQLRSGQRIRWGIIAILAVLLVIAIAYVIIIR